MVRHWQCESVQDTGEKPWRHEGLRNFEKRLPQLKEESSERSARSCKATTGVGCDGFHPRVPFDLPKESRGEVVKFLQKVEQCGKWPQQACMHDYVFLDPEERHERALHRASLLCGQMVGVAACARGEETTRRHRVDWDVTEKRNGSAEGIAREWLLEVDLMTEQVKWTRERSRMLDLAKTFERVSLSVAWACATHFNYFGRFLRVFCG